MNDRNKVLLKNIFGAFSIKGLALIVNFFTVPLYMKYFEDNSILGVWYTILSFLSWILTFDLGIGNGLRNQLVKPLLENDKTKIKKLLSSAYIVLGILTLIIIISGILIINYLNWNEIFNINSLIISNKYLKIAFLISFTGVAFQFFLKLALSILNAMEKTALSNAVLLISSIINLLYLIINSKGSDVYRLIKLSIIYALSVNIPLVISTIIIFCTIFKDSKPNIKYFDKEYARSIVNLGMNFFIIQILFMIITASNEFFISNIFGANKVVEFQIYNKIFYTFVTLYSLISNPVWSAVARAKSEKNMIWIKKIYKKLLLSACVGILGVFFISLIFQPILNIWLGSNTVIANHFYVICFGIYVSVMFLVFAMNSVANGLQLLRPQIISFSFAVIFKIVILYVFKEIWSDWIIVIIINTVALIPYVFWQMKEFKKIRLI